MNAAFGLRLAAAFFAGFLAGAFFATFFAGAFLATGFFAGFFAAFFFVAIVFPPVSSVSIAVLESVAVTRCSGAVAEECRTFSRYASAFSFGEPSISLCAPQRSRRLPRQGSESSQWPSPCALSSTSLP